MMCVSADSRITCYIIPGPSFTLWQVSTRLSTLPVHVWPRGCNQIIKKKLYRLSGVGGRTSYVAQESPHNEDLRDVLITRTVLWRWSRKWTGCEVRLEGLGHSGFWLKTHRRKTTSDSQMRTVEGMWAGKCVSFACHGWYLRCSTLARFGSLMLSGCRWGGNVFGFCSRRKTSSDTIVCSVADDIDTNRHVLIVACI